MSKRKIDMKKQYIYPSANMTVFETQDIVAVSLIAYGNGENDVDVDATKIPGITIE